MQSSLLNVADFRDLEYFLSPCPVYISMPYVHVATE
jgi:hypothetical protein